MPDPDALHDSLVVGGEMGERIRAYDWNATPLGPIERWPQSLKTSLSLMLAARMPIWLAWTPEMVCFYNDAFVSVLGHAKHPWALGRPAREVWRDIWDLCGPLADKVFGRGEASVVEAVRLFMDRGMGLHEEAYWSFSYSPIRDESGRVAGLFCPCTEVSATLIHARRLQTLAELGAVTEQTIDAALASAVTALAKNPDDVPFALIYLAERDGLVRRQAVRVPSSIDDARWKLDEAFRGRAVVQTLDSDLALPVGLAGARVREIVALPLAAAADRRPLGVLVAGVNPTRRLDAEHRMFFELLAARLSNALHDTVDRSDEALYALIQQVPVAITIRRGPELRCVSQNDAAIAILDQRGETLRESWPHAPAHWFDTLDHVYQTGQSSTERELVMKRSWSSDEAPSDHYFDMALAPLRLPDGPIDGVLTVCVDVTERKLAEERAHVTLGRLEAALAASQIGTYVWNMRTHRVEHDSGVERLFGVVAKHGAAIDEYTARIHPDDRSEWLAAIEASEKHGADFHQEYRVVHDDGVFWLLDKGNVVRDAAGPAYMVGAVVDITEPKRLADAALAASRAKDEFLAMLGHELRNPLAPIVTALQIMKLRGAPASKERDTIERQVKHLVRLVDDLLDISRVTRGLIELHRERLDLSEVLGKAVEIASPLIEQKHHQLALDVPTGLFVDGDAIRLAQVFANLLTNAARYTPAHGQIAVSASRVGDRIAVRVRDNGSGIASDQLDSIFELFVQGGERGAARSQGGLGIGLALVRNLLKLHDATVVAASDGPGMGSTFTVELHAAAAPEALADAESPMAIPATTRRVLVVDDNTDAADTLCAALQHLGHEVRVANDGPQALRVVDAFHPDAAVLDIGLPVMDGYELARRLRARGLDDCLFVAVTGYGQDEDRKRSHEAGFDAHMVKPIDFSRLADMLAPA